MSQDILYCVSCKTYTMDISCPRCGEVTQTRKPEKYSPEDKYGSYRRKAKELLRKQEGLL